MTEPGPASGASRGRGRPRDPDADDAILRAAFELFVERGVDGTSIEQIAKHAGVGKLTVYRRWSSKEELLAAAIELIIEDDGPWPANDELERAEPREIVERMMPAAAEMAATPRYRAMMARMLGSSVSHPSLMATYWKHYILPRREAVGAMLEYAKRQGTVASDADVDVLIDMMAGAVMYRVLQPNPPDAAEMRRYLTAVYRQVGLLPPDGAPE
ncbi:MAG: TetR family transcriptional regulator [Pseudonocardiaceae bacterium]|nr:TetR family transcriptional regulator [Pseudonocardiaceae bacterium]